jgi:hypothetical protein
MSVDGLYDDQPAEGQLDWPRHGVSVEEPGRIDENFNERDQGRQTGPERSEGTEPAISQPSSDRPESAESTDSEQNPEDVGWSWKGLELSPHANRVAEAGLEQRRTAEGRDADGNYTDRGITPAMRRIEADLEHGSLVPDTEKFALKSPDRFKEKLAKMITRYPDKSPEELTASIHDGIRFTFAFDAAGYTKGVEQVRAKLQQSGYELESLKPSWDSSDYKGVNSRWRESESKVLFEVQFHTYASWHVKQETHDLYEKMQDSRTTPQERGRLESEQRRLVSCVPVPDGAAEIAPYRKAEFGA